MGLSTAQQIVQVLADGPLDHAQIANRVSVLVTSIGPALKQLLDDGIIVQEQIDGRTVFKLA